MQWGCCIRAGYQIDERHPRIERKLGYNNKLYLALKLVQSPLMGHDHPLPREWVVWISDRILLNAKVSRWFVGLNLGVEQPRFTVSLHFRGWRSDLINNHHHLISSLTHVPQPVQLFHPSIFLSTVHCGCFIHIGKKCLEVDVR